jgi:hypothetical protein
MRTDLEFETALRYISPHETGHALVSWHFEIAAVPRLPLSADGDFMEFAVSERESRGTDFEQSCIGWGGIIAQALTDNPSPWMEEKLPWKLTEENLEAWYWTVLKEFECLSRGDQQCIQSYFDPLKSCRFAAFKILTENLDELKRLSVELSAHTLARRQTILNAKLKAEIETENRRWEGVPRPTLPANVDTFVALVAGDKSCFETFLEHRARLHLTNQRTADEAEIRKCFNGTFDVEFSRALSLQRNLYEKFPNPAAWLGAVACFRQWANLQPQTQT